MNTDAVAIEVQAVPDVAAGPSAVQSLKRAFLILDQFSRQEPMLGLSQLAARVDLSKATVRRLLITLQELGLVDQDPHTRKYRLGLKLFELGTTVADSIGPRRLALPVLRHLTVAVEETSYFVVPYRGQGMCLEKVEGSHYIRPLFLNVGECIPLHAGAAGRAILAHLPPAELDAILSKGLPALAEDTITDRVMLLRDLQSIRQKGYSQSRNDVTVGSSAVGAPVRGSDGSLIGAISIGVCNERATDERLEALAQHVRFAADQISQALGHNLYSLYSYDDQMKPGEESSGTAS